jgi:HTH-type transcriptional regulator / antitoxin MqsA
MINNAKVICPLCESGELIFKTSPWTYCYKEHDFVLEDIEFAECTSCHSELILPDQSRRNEARIRDEHCKIDGLLTSIDIAQLRKRFHLTESQASQIFGSLDFSKYETGEQIQNIAVDRLMRLTLKVPQCFEELCKIAKVQR